MDSRGTGRKGKPKVKSGCRTCKARKVKCDEGRPSCQRCVSTGRYCDGYGIWGGGSGSTAKSMQVACPKDQKVNLSRPLSPTLVSSLNAEERQYFEWFRSRTALKIPGTFVSGFWKSLLLQAGSSDPAVLHAILALSSVQNVRCLEFDSEVIGTTPRQQEQFILRHYLKAITCLRPTLTSKDRASNRATLITCTIFVCLEFFRGYFDSAQTHFNNGIRVMEQLGLLVRESDHVLRFEPSSDPVDDWIVEVFSRLQLQIELMKYWGSEPLLVLQIDVCTSPPTTVKFQNIYRAWRDLSRLFNEVFKLTNRCRRQSGATTDSTDTMTLLKQQRQLRKDLSSWGDRHDGLKTAPSPRTSAEIRHGQKICHDMLDIYDDMLKIMLETCLQPDNQTQFDVHTDLFLGMMSKLGSMWDYTAIIQHATYKNKHKLHVSRSIADLGVVAPLWFVAVKCRVHRIRVHAVKLLESVAHREGIWDSQLSGCVARKVMENEEADFYLDTDIDDDFDLFTLPGAEDAVALPALPERNRFGQVEMALAGSPMDSIILTCTNRSQGADVRCRLSTYDVNSETWIDLDAVDPLSPSEYSLSDITAGTFSSSGGSPNMLESMIYTERSQRVKERLCPVSMYDVHAETWADIDATKTLCPNEWTSTNMDPGTFDSSEGSSDKLGVIY